MAECILCGTMIDRIERVSDLDALDLDCPTCGRFRITGMAMRHIAPHPGFHEEDPVPQ